MNATLRKLLGLAVRTSRIVRRNPKDLRFLLGHADYAASLIDDPDGDVRDVPEIDFGELTTLFGGTIRYEVQSFAGVPASVSPLEANAIALIVRSLPTRVAFEFGTYKGISTTQIALNLAMNGVVHTIDLPEDDPTASLSISDSYERELTREGGKGHLIPSELLGRVRFHSTDSAHFDEEPFAGCADFVFVDGAAQLRIRDERLRKIVAHAPTRRRDCLARLRSHPPRRRALCPVRAIVESSSHLRHGFGLRHQARLTGMRITLLTHSLDPGGSTAFTLQLWKLFESWEDLVTIIVGAASSVPGLPPHNVVAARSSPRDRMLAYRERILEGNPDVVYSLSGIEEFRVLSALNVPRIRHIFSLENFRATNIPWLIRHTSPYVELFTSNTPDVGDFIRSEVPTARCAVAPYLLDPNWFADSFDPPQRAFPDGEIAIAFVGRLERYQKRAHWLVPVILACEKAGAPFRWEIFGDGPLKPELQSRLEKGSVDSSKITFHGWVDESQLRKTLPAHDVFFLASRWEGLPVAMVQAMAAGLACVVPGGRGGMEYALQDSASGWAYQASSWRDAVGSLLEIAKAPKAVAAKGAAASRIAREKFSPNVATRQLRDLRNALGNLSPNGRVAPIGSKQPVGAPLFQRVRSRAHQLATFSPQE